METHYTNKENGQSIITRTHDLYDQYSVYNASTGTYSQTYGKYQESGASLSGVLTGISYNHDDISFKADPVLDQQDIRNSQKSPNTIYFTPEGIMLGGWLIAEPTPYGRIEALETAVQNLEGVSGNALKFVGVISDNGYVDGLNVQEFPQEVIERNYSNSFKMSGSTAYYSTNKIVGRSQLNGVFLDIEPIVDRIVQSMQNANSNNPINVTLDSTQPIANLKLVIPHGYADEAHDAEIIDITLPHTFTLQECQNIQLAKNSGYAGELYDHNGAQSGVMLYIEGATGSGVQVFTQNTLLLGRPLKFSALAPVAGLESGYTFVAQSSCTLIPGDSTTDVAPGDFVIINNDIPQDPNAVLTANDFSIIHTNRSVLANATTDGLMSAQDYSLLHNVADRRASSSQIGQVKIPNGYGLKIDDQTGSLTTNLSLDLAAVSGLRGLRLFLDDADSEDALSSVDILQATTANYGIVKIDDDTVKINNSGQLYATAKLTWS